MTFGRCAAETVSSIVADMSVAMMSVFGKREVRAKVTAPVPAATSRTKESLVIGDRLSVS